MQSSDIPTTMAVPTQSVVRDTEPTLGNLQRTLARPEVSVVIPCLNEADSIESCVNKALTALLTGGIPGEIIVADNGSSDNSRGVAARCGARVIPVPVRGYGSALRKGIEQARGDFVLIGDADDTYDFSELPRFVDKWRAGYDLVMGNRFKGEIKAGAMPWHHRRLGTPVMSAMVNCLFATKIGDVNCGMRGFSRTLIQRLSFSSTGMEFASESLIVAAKSGARICEVPITLWPGKPNRVPHLRSFRDGFRHLFLIACHALNLK